MDLAQYDITEKAERGADLVLAHPVTGEPLDAVITLVGHDSAAYRNKLRDFAQQQISKGKGKPKLDLDASEKQAAELLAACTIGWSNIDEGGKAIPFSREACIDVYRKYRWIREQVDAFVGDRGNFFAA